MIELDLSNRNSLVSSLPPHGVVGEIGVADGAFSEVILNRHHPRLLYLIDCWKHQSVKVYGHDPANAPDHVHLARYMGVCERYRADPRVAVLRGYSLELAPMFPEDTFDWLYLDPNHLQLRKDLEAWWTKVKSGGWFLGHDYTVAGDYITVKPTVDQFVAERNLDIQVTRGDGDIYEKNYPTWIFRKP